MIARHQTLPAPNTFIKLIHSALQDNGVAAGKVSIASQKSNPDSIGTEIIRAGSTMALALVSFVRTTFNRRATRGEWGRRLPGRRPPANSAADECIWSEIYGAHTEAGTERWVDQCTYQRGQPTPNRGRGREDVNQILSGRVDEKEIVDVVVPR